MPRQARTDRWVDDLPGPFRDELRSDRGGGRGGVCERTVYNHLRLEPALKAGAARLEAEAVRERLEAHKRLRAAVDSAWDAEDAGAAAERGIEFDRTMKLLARWDRKNGGFGPRRVGCGHERTSTFGGDRCPGQEAAQPRPAQAGTAGAGGGIATIETD